MIKKILILLSLLFLTSCIAKQIDFDVFDQKTDDATCSKGA